jgi:hypothetical protein
LIVSEAKGYPVHVYRTRDAQIWASQNFGPLISELWPVSEYNNPQTVGIAAFFRLHRLRQNGPLPGGLIPNFQSSSHNERSSVAQTPRGPDVRRSPGPTHFADIVASVAATGQVQELVTGAIDSDNVAPTHAQDPGMLRSWLLHETQTLREPVYRTEARDREKDSGSATGDPIQLPLLHYDYGSGVVVLSQMGELTARDLRVMSVISQVFYANGCPADNTIYGDEATLGFICRQLGLNPAGYVKLVKASVERLATSKVLWRINSKIVDDRGATTGSDQGEVAVGFITNFGSRRKKVKGEAQIKNNFMILDPLMAQMIRSGKFTWLRADTMRRLSSHALATKLYAFMRTHRPNDRGEIEYGLATLATKLGCSDKKRSRVRVKLIAAAEAVCKESPAEFPKFHLRAGVRDDVLVLQKTRRAEQPPLAVLPSPTRRLPRPSAIPLVRAGRNS